MRINRFLALCGLGSRRECENLIKLGQVQVNGEFVWDLGVRVGATDVVIVNGVQVLAPAQRRVVMLHKPAGYLCSKGDQFGRRTIYDLLPSELQNLHYIGRLDANTRGLLLLTDDGELSRRLTHPSFAMSRCYQVNLDSPLSNAQADVLETGLVLDDGTAYRPVRLSGVGYHFDIELREGKKREIREMMKYFGHRVEDLFRYEYAGLWLDTLPEGEHRELDATEIQSLLEQVGL